MLYRMKKDVTLANKKIVDVNRHALEVQYQDEIDRLLIKSLEERAAIEVDAAKKLELQLQASKLRQNISARDAKQSTITEPQDFENLGIDFLQRQLSLKKQLNQATIADELDTAIKIRDIHRIYGSSTLEDDEKIAVLRKQLVDEVFDYTKRGLDAVSNIAGQNAAYLVSTITDAIHEMLQKSGREFEDWAQVAIAASSFIDDMLAKSSQAQIDRLEKQKDKELQIVGNNQAAQNAINQRYAKEEAKIKRKQAIDDKVTALFQIAINTAVAVSKLLSDTALAGTPLIPILIALGAAQAALVLAQPIPKFRTGTSYAPQGPAIVDEAGRELIIDRHGNLKEMGSNSGPRLTYLAEGDKVIPHEKTLQIQKIAKEIQLTEKLSGNIREGKRAEQIFIMNSAIGGDRMNYEMLGKVFGSELDKRPVIMPIFDERGARTKWKKDNETKTFLNRYRFGNA